MAKKQILAVDDEAEMLDLIYKRLSERGYDVVMAVTGQEALDKARRRVPDLILMDIVLPDIEGPDVIRKLKEEDPEMRKIPVIFLSGIVGEHDNGSKQSEIQVGGQMYCALPKPFVFETLVEKIEESLYL